jgi:predicted RNA polymerase sigma factor
LLLFPLSPLRDPRRPRPRGAAPGAIAAIYLLFNGGYTTGEGEALMGRELCAEALRLATLLTIHPTTATSECHALAALISFHHARAEARIGLGAG